MNTGAVVALRRLRLAPFQPSRGSSAAQAPVIAHGISGDEPVTPGAGPLVGPSGALESLGCHFSALLSGQGESGVIRGCRADSGLFAPLQPCSGLFCQERICAGAVLRGSLPPGWLGSGTPLRRCCCGVCPPLRPYCFGVRRVAWVHPRIHSVHSRARVEFRGPLLFSLSFPRVEERGYPPPFGLGLSSPGAVCERGLFTGPGVKVPTNDQLADKSFCG